MGMYGGFYSGDKKKVKREKLERVAQKIKKIQIAPKVEIIGKGKAK